VAVATGVEPVPPDRQSGIPPLDSATTSDPSPQSARLRISPAGSRFAHARKTAQLGCEGTIRTCMNRVRAGYPGQLNDLATLRREPADTVCFLDKRSNRSLHHPSNFSPLLVNERPPSLTTKLAAGGRFERPYPDSKSRVLPLDDPASRPERDCFHAPYTQHR
jgi:hypothetical protein